MEESIKYYEEDFWKKFFNIDLAEFYSSVEGFLLLRENLIREISSESVSKLISRSNIYREILFGGFKASGSEPFINNALAKFYENVLGIGLENIQLVISRLREGLTLESATEDIYCKPKEEGLVLTRLREISSKLKVIYKKLRDIVEPPEPREYRLDSSMSCVNAFLDILNTGKKLLPLYNPTTFFIMSIYSIPKFYSKEIYTKLFNEDIQSLLRKYDIDIVKLLEPDLPDEKIRERREIIGLQKDCVGWLIREIILDIYSLFQIDELKNFFTIEDEFNKYIGRYIGKLKESIAIDRFTPIINAIKFANQTDSYDHKYRCKIKINNLKFYYSPQYGKSPEYRGKIIGGEVRIGYMGQYRLNYTEFFAFLAPQMFLGLAYARPVSANEFIWLCTLGWET